MSRVPLTQFERKKDLDGDGKVWTLLDAFTSLKEARKLANEMRKEGRPWGKKTGGDFNVRIMEFHLCNTVYYRRK